MVEAAGVELSSVLRTRNILILGTATRAKKAPLPDPLYVYCTKMLTLWRAEPHSEQYRELGARTRAMLTHALS